MSSTLEQNLYIGKRLRMSDTTKQLTREERLAAKLRDNLRRRKSQARAIAADTAGSGSDSPATETMHPAGDSGENALPKVDRDS